MTMLIDARGKVPDARWIGEGTEQDGSRYDPTGRRVIIRPVINADETSSPFHTFLLSRTAVYSDERQIFCTLRNIEYIRRGIAASPDRERIEVGHWRFGLLGYFVGVRRLLHRLKAEGASVCIHAHHPKLAFPLFLFLKCIGERTPTLFTVHTSYSECSATHKLFTRLACSIADRVTFVGKQAMGAFPSARNERITCIPNGVDIRRIRSALNPRSGVAVRKSGSLRIVTVGRLIECKNHEFMLRVLQTLDVPVTWTIIGEGERMEPLQRIVANGFAHPVSFEGLRTREEVFRQLHEADVFASPSRREGMPMAVLEAMAAGLPVMLSDIPPHAELKESKGVFVFPLDVEAWRVGVGRLHGMSPEERGGLGAANLKFVETYHSNMQMMHKYRMLYEELWAADQGE